LNVNTAKIKQLSMPEKLLGLSGNRSLAPVFLQSWINPCSLVSTIGFPDTYLLYSHLSGG